MTGVPFIKMHGLGNDFVVLDGRERRIPLSSERVRAIADRHTGVGCDQLILLERADTGLADVAMRIFNADGGEVEACGNASRCIASLLLGELGRDHMIIETKAGLLDAEEGPGGIVRVDMGRVKLDWRDIPIKDATDTLHLGLTLGPLSDPVAVNVGNPHAVFFVPDAEKIDLAALGPLLERHAMFPERANIEVAQVLSADRIRARVWERGTGITLACGTGACAVLVAAHRRALTGRKADIVLDGGVLTAEWLKDDHVLLSGPAEVSFTGMLSETLLPQGPRT
ncbi:MAG: diaminopimelate epimerase [Alphaproteobacteria bacterium]